MKELNIKSRNSINAHIDAYAREISEVGQSSSDAAVRQMLIQQLWVEAFKLEPYLRTVLVNGQQIMLNTEEERADVLNDAIISSLKNFSPDKGAFSHLLERHICFRTLDYVNRKITKDSLENSIDAPLRDTSIEDELQLKDVIEEPKHHIESWEIDYFCNEALDKVTIIIFSFLNSKPSKDVTKERKNWYRIFFTEGITYAAKLNLHSERREKEIFQALNENYLDYYMADACRSMNAIMVTPLKTYRQLGLKCPGKAKMSEKNTLDSEYELNVVSGKMLPAKLSIDFMKSLGNPATDSLRSQMFSHYKELLKCVHDALVT